MSATPSDTARLTRASLDKKRLASMPAELESMLVQADLDVLCSFMLPHLSLDQLTALRSTCRSDLLTRLENLSAFSDTTVSTRRFFNIWLWSLTEACPHISLLADWTRGVPLSGVYFAV